jgi:hypothetical protein
MALNSIVGNLLIYTLLSLKWKQGQLILCEQQWENTFTSAI